MYVVYGISHTIVYIISSVWYSSVVMYVRIWLAQGWEGQWLHLHQEYEGNVFSLLLFYGVRANGQDLPHNCVHKSLTCLN